MNSNRKWLFSLAVIVTSALCVGCPDPNLQPKHSGSDCCYCDLDDNGALLVTIGNVSTKPASGSTTRIVFYDAQTGEPLPAINHSTGELPAHGEATSAVDIPAECHNAAGIRNCAFRITADIDNDVTEDFEIDNVVNGECIQ